MARAKKKKLTKKDLLKLINIMGAQMQNLTIQVFNGDQALDMYIEMKGEKDEFIKFLQEKQKNDQDKQETKEK